MLLRERRGIDVNLRAGPQLREYETIADRIARDAPGRVLDWGCGWGQVSALLEQRGVSVTAYDFRPDEPAGRRSLERFPQITADVGGDPVRLPYEDEAFDAILSCGVLEHVEDPDGSLEELRRVLRPGGTLYVFKLPNRFSYLELAARALGLYYHGKLPHDRVYTRSSASQLLRRHGYTVVEERRFNMLPLTLDAPWAQQRSDSIWRANAALSRVPGLNALATNIEVVAEAR